MAWPAQAALRTTRANVPIGRKSVASVCGGSALFFGLWAMGPCQFEPGADLPLLSSPLPPQGFSSYFPGAAPCRRSSKGEHPEEAGVLPVRVRPAAGALPL